MSVVKDMNRMEKVRIIHEVVEAILKAMAYLACRGFECYTKYYDHLRLHFALCSDFA